MKGTGKKKIEIKRIEKKSSRMVTFSKRRQGLFKKAVELGEKTGARVAIVVISPANNPYTYGDIPAMSALVDRAIAMNNNNNNNNNNYMSVNNGEVNCRASSSKPNFEKTMMQLHNVINVDGCRSLEEISKSKTLLEQLREKIANQGCNA